MPPSRAAPVGRMLRRVLRVAEVAAAITCDRYSHHRAELCESCIYDSPLVDAVAELPAADSWSRSTARTFSIRRMRVRPSSRSR